MLTCYFLPCIPVERDTAVSDAGAPRGLGVHKYPLPRALFQRFGFQTHLDALRTLSALLWFRVELSKSFPQVILADMPCPSATKTTFTTWTSFDQIAHTLLRVDSALSGGMTIPQTNTGSEPNSEIDVAGKFVPIADLTHDDGDTISQIPTSRCSSPRLQMLHLTILRW